MSKVTELLGDMHDGDAEAAKKLFALVYDELHKMASGLMAGEHRKGHTLQPTALVNEAFIRLVEGADLRAPDSRRYFFFTAARAMRQLLIEHERKHAVRGGKLNRKGEDVLGGIAGPPGLGSNALVGSDDEHPWDNILNQIRSQYGVGFGELAEVIDKLAIEDEGAATVVWLRFMGGMTMQEIGECLGIPETQADGEWRVAKKWLKRRLEGLDE